MLSITSKALNWTKNAIGQRRSTLPNLSSPSPSNIRYFSTHKLEITNSWLPTWYEKDIDNFRGIDLLSRLLKDRIVFVDGPVCMLHSRRSLLSQMIKINNVSASITVSQLLLLEAEDSKAQISMYINSPGGEIHAGLAIYDTMQYIKSPVSTICIGQACSMASLLLVAGAPGLRRALPHSFVMIHQPSSGTQGQASDIEIHAKHVLHLKSMLNHLYKKHTGLDLRAIEQALDRDTWLTASQAKEWKLIDEIIERKEPPTASGSAGSNSTSPAPVNHNHQDPNLDDLPMAGSQVSQKAH